VLASIHDLPLSVGDPAARAAIAGRCPAIAVAAPNAEAVHDRIDNLLEASGADDVLTTFSDTLSEAISMVDTGLAKDGRIYAFSDEPSSIESELKTSGLLP
jgi:hypothetical protein